MSRKHRVGERSAAGVRTYESRALANPDEDIFDQGLAFDLETAMGRRQVLRLLGVGTAGVGVLALGGCAAASSSSSEAASASFPASAAASSVATTAAGDCDTAIPEETAGPYPADGTNGPDVLSQSGVVRRDIRSSFGDATGTAEGIPLTIKLAITDQANGCSAYAGAAVYLWHCDREGRYSLYSQGVENENYLRGVQEADTDGVVTFQSVFPACYSGRWPHIHFEVYPSLVSATDSANKIATSQIALPEDVCTQVYATDGYSQSVTNMAQVSLTSDNVFGEDGGAQQLGMVTGSIDGGLIVELDVPVNQATLS